MTHYSQHALEVFDRMQLGDYPVHGAGGNLWWCNKGHLIEHLSVDEAAGLDELLAGGVVSQHTTQRAA